MDEPEQAARNRPATHIFSTAGTMLGVTTTLIGLVKLLETQSQGSQVDALAGCVMVLFLFAAVTSYASIRTASRIGLSGRLERLADGAFMLGLTCLAVVAIIFAWDVI